MMPEWLWNDTPPARHPVMVRRRGATSHGNASRVGATEGAPGPSPKLQPARWPSRGDSSRFEVAVYVGLLLMLIAWGASLYWIGVR